MRIHRKGLAVIAAVALVVGMTSAALAIEAFQERFEWGDMSKPTPLQGRVIVVDPYDEAVWINIAVFGGNAESGLWWQRTHPGKTLKFYAANKEVWGQLSKMARPHAGPAAAKDVPPGTEAKMIQFMAQETEQNHRVISAVKEIADVAGAMGKPRSINGLRADACQQAKSDFDKPCYDARVKQATAGKGRDNTRMQYDVVLPGGKVYASGLIPFSPNEDTLK